LEPGPNVTAAFSFSSRTIHTCLIGGAAPADAGTAPARAATASVVIVNRRASRGIGVQYPASGRVLAQVL
jgi:hypothetical protein